MFFEHHRKTSSAGRCPAGLIAQDLHWICVHISFCFCLQGHKSYSTYLGQFPPPISRDILSKTQMLKDHILDAHRTEEANPDVLQKKCMCIAINNMYMCYLSFPSSWQFCVLAPGQVADAQRHIGLGRVVHGFRQLFVILKAPTRSNRIPPRHIHP